MNRHIKEQIKESIISTLIIYMALGTVAGAISSASSRIEGKDGCVYRSYTAYMFISYLITCELSRSRFNIEQPIQYTASDVKVIK